MKKSLIKSNLFLTAFIAAIFTAPVVSAPLALAEDGPKVAQSESSEQLDFANGLFSRKMYKMAADEYEKFISSYPEDPKTPRVYFMVAESLFYLGDYRSATEAYDEYLKRFAGDKDAVHAKLRIIASAIELKDCDRAMAEAEPFVSQTHPPDIRGEALYLIGLSRLSCGDKETAAKYFKEACDIGKDSTYSAVAAYQLGRISRDAKDLAGAIDWFDKSAALAQEDEIKALSRIGGAEARIDLGNFKEAAEILRPLALGDSGASETKDRAVLGLARALYGMKAYGELIDSYKKIRGSMRSPSLRMQTVVFVSQAYTKEQRDAESIAILDAILTDTSLTPSELESVFFARISALIAAKKYEEARSLLDSKKDYIDLSRAAFLKAETDYYLKSYAEARKGYDYFLITYPDSPLRAQAFYGMAFAAMYNNEKHVAKDVFLKIVSSFPDDELAGKALYSAAALEEELGLAAEGISHAKKYIELYGDREDTKAVRLLLGRLYGESKKPSEAIKVYEDYLARYPADPKIPEVYFMIGRSYQAAGDRMRSTEYFSKIAKDAPGAGELYYKARSNIAQNYIAMKNELEAAKTMDDILSSDRTNENAFENYLWVVKRYIDAKLYKDAMRVLDISSKHKEADKNKAAIEYYKSEAERGLGNYDAAVAGYERCIKMDEPAQGALTGAAYQGMGLTFLARNDINQARKSFESAIAFNPSDNTVVMRSRYYLADILASENKYDEAAKMYMMVAILYEDNSFVPSSLYKAILAFEKIGKKDETEKACRDFLARFPGDERSAEINKILGKIENVQR
ncbi:MAG TPA: tetratricopeptide repeat protein [Candidatus Omnitrophota bacterium]|nr:tetratricopeptide repeat protein [Candidatus Omnitrophota bacterium]